MEDDPELKAMGKIAAAVKGLDEETVKRVLDWAVKRFRPLSIKETLVQVLGNAEELSSTFKDFPALFDAADPDSMTENALVAAYWFQVVCGQNDFDSASINKELKHLGRASSNITRDLDGLMAQTPRLVIQTRKSGSAKQARKQYKLTTEGVRLVQRMLERKKE